MRQQFFRLSLAVAAILLLPSLTFAETMSSQNYVIEQGAFTSGGGNSASSSYSLFGSLGENYLSEAASSNFQLGGVAGTNTIPTPTPAPSTDEDGDAGDEADCCPGPDPDSGSSPISASGPKTSGSARPSPAATAPPEVPSLITQLFTPVTSLFEPSSEESSSEVGSEPAEEGIPAQLFDIRLLLDRDTVSRIQDLVARVEFTSFGREPTPVEMTFSLVDASGMELWSSVDTTTVQTEAIFVKRFTDVNELPDGSYTLRLTTLYNTDVRDTFEAPFSVSSSAGVSRWVLWLVLGLAALMIVVALFFLWRRRRDDSEEERARF